MDIWTHSVLMCKLPLNDWPPKHRLPIDASPFHHHWANTEVNVVTQIDDWLICLFIVPANEIESHSHARWTSNRCQHSISTKVWFDVLNLNNIWSLKCKFMARLLSWGSRALHGISVALVQEILERLTEMPWNVAASKYRQLLSPSAN